MSANKSESTLTQIYRYQKKLEKYSQIGENGNNKLLYYIHKLKYLPVTLPHLEISGIGKSVNYLRHTPGQVGVKARALVEKWKEMVNAVEAEEQAQREKQNKLNEKSKIIHNEDDDDSDEQNLQIEEQVNDEENDNECNGYNPETSVKDYMSIQENSCEPIEYNPTSCEPIEYNPTSCEPIEYNPTLCEPIEYNPNSCEPIEYTPTSKNILEISPKSSSIDESLPNGDDRSKKIKHGKKKHHKSKHRSRQDSKSKHESKERKEKSKVKHKSKHRSISPNSHSYGEMLNNSSASSPNREAVCHEKSPPPYYKGIANTSFNAGRYEITPIKSKIINNEEGKVGTSVTYKNMCNYQPGVSDTSREDLEKSNNSESIKKNKKQKHERGESKHKDSSKSKKKSKRKREVEECSGFDAALKNLDSSSRKKKKKKSKMKDDSPSEHEKKSKHNGQNSKFQNLQPNKLDEDYGKILPDLDLAESEFSVPSQLLTHYKPLPHIPNRHVDYYPSRITQEESLNYMLSSRHTSKHRKLYTGKKTGLTSVPSLFKCCIRVLQENIVALEATGGIPYDILKPVFEKATPKQLENLENFNPYLLEHTDELWACHCRKEFKTKVRDEMETWRELYFRCCDENVARMRLVTENLQKKYITKAAPKRTTQLAFTDTFAKPPKSVARAQAKYGTGAGSAFPVRPSSSESGGSGGKRNPSGNARLDKPFVPHRPPASKKPKVAPLMAKTRQLMKKVCRR